MKRKIIAFVTAVILVIGVCAVCLTGCVSSDMGKLINKDYQAANAAGPTEITALDGYTRTSEIYGGMAIFEKDGNMNLFSFKNSSFVIKDKNVQNTSIYFYLTNETDTSKVDVYTHSGIAVTCALSDIRYEGITVDNKVYAYNDADDLVVKEKRADFVPHGGGFVYETKKLRIECGNSSFGRAFYVFEKKTNKYINAVNLIDYFTEDIRFYSILANGKVVTQEKILLPNDAKDYDYFSEGNKYRLKTQIIDLENGKAKEIDTNFVLEDVYNNFNIENNIFAKDINIIAYYEIVDQQLIPKQRVQAVDSSLKVKVDLQKILPGANGIDVDPDGTITLENDVEVLNYKDKKTNFKYNKSGIVSTNLNYIITEKGIFDKFGNQAINKENYKKFVLRRVTVTDVIYYNYLDDDDNVVYVLRDRNGVEKKFDSTYTFNYTGERCFSLKDAEGNLTVYYDDLNAPINATPIKASICETEYYSVGESEYMLMTIGTKHYALER